jgi:hypothetical protein
MTTVLAFLSNQPMHNPCSTTHSGTEITSSCGFPVKTLQHGGVLVMLILGGMPGWKIASQTGHHLVVDHHAARESVTHNPSGSLHATNEISIFIASGVRYNYYEVAAFFREPGAAKDQRLLGQMINSMKIEQEHLGLPTKDVSNQKISRKTSEGLHAVMMLRQLSDTNNPTA